MNGTAAPPQRDNDQQKSINTKMDHPRTVSTSGSESSTKTEENTRPFIDITAITHATRSSTLDEENALDASRSPEIGNHAIDIDELFGGMRDQGILMRQPPGRRDAAGTDTLPSRNNADARLANSTSATSHQDSSAKSSTNSNQDSSSNDDSSDDGYYRREKKMAASRPKSNDGGTAVPFARDKPLGAMKDNTASVDVEVEGKISPKYNKNESQSKDSSSSSSSSDDPSSSGDDSSSEQDDLNAPRKTNTKSSLASSSSHARKEDSSREESLSSSEGTNRIVIDVSTSSSESSSSDDDDSSSDESESKHPRKKAADNGTARSSRARMKPKSSPNQQERPRPSLIASKPTAKKPKLMPDKEPMVGDRVYAYFKSRKYSGWWWGKVSKVTRKKHSHHNKYWVSSTAAAWNELSMSTHLYTI